MDSTPKGRRQFDAVRLTYAPFGRFVVVNSSFESANTIRTGDTLGVQYQVLNLSAFGGDAVNSIRSTPGAIGPAVAGAYVLRAAIGRGSAADTLDGTIQIELLAGEIAIATNAVDNPRALPQPWTDIVATGVVTAEDIATGRDLAIQITAFEGTPDFGKAFVDDVRLQFVELGPSFP